MVSLWVTQAYFTADCVVIYTTLTTGNSWLKWRKSKIGPEKLNILHYPRRSRKRSSHISTIKYAKLCVQFPNWRQSSAWQLKILQQSLALVRRDDQSAIPLLEMWKHSAEHNPTCLKSLTARFPNLQCILKPSFGFRKCKIRVSGLEFCPRPDIGYRWTTQSNQQFWKAAFRPICFLCRINSVFKKTNKFCSFSSSSMSVSHQWSRGTTFITSLLLSSTYLHCSRCAVMHYQYCTPFEKHCKLCNITNHIY